MRRLPVMFLFALSAAPVDAAHSQIIRSGRLALREPQLWLSAGAALQQGWTVTDGRTGIRWEMSDAVQYGGGVERAIRGGTTVGLRASTARVPLRYAPTPGIAGTPQEADVNVSQGFALLRVSSGREFHTVLELGAGATVYSNFRARGTGVSLAPTSPDTDFTFAFGYGFGYSFSRAFQVDVVQDLATTLHQKTGLSAGDNSSARISSTRLIARYGLGS